MRVKPTSNGEEMWIEYIANSPYVFWIFLGIVGISLLLALVAGRWEEEDSLQECMDYYCRCFARGEISEEDLEELKIEVEHYCKEHNCMNYSCEADSLIHNESR